MRWLISKLLLVPMIIYAVWVLRIAWEQSADYETLGDWGMAIGLYLIFVGIPFVILHGLRRMIHTPSPKPRRSKASPKTKRKATSVPTATTPATMPEPKPRGFAEPPMVHAARPVTNQTKPTMSQELAQFTARGQQAIDGET